MVWKWGGYSGVSIELRKVGPEGDCPVLVVHVDVLPVCVFWLSSCCYVWPVCIGVPTIWGMSGVGFRDATLLPCP